MGLVFVSGWSTEAASAIAAGADVSQVTQDLTVQWIPARRALSQMRAVLTASSETDPSGAFSFPRINGTCASPRPTMRGFRPPAVVVLSCVLDTGIDPNHLDLAGKVDLAKSTSFVATEPFIEDLNTHGTFVAAIVSSNGLGVASVAPNATLAR